MGHSVIVWGHIKGLIWDSDGERTLEDHNRRALTNLPKQDAWPALIGAMFSAPPHSPTGTYREQIIHFGASYKDEPDDDKLWLTWIEDKFEQHVLLALYWSSVSLVLETEFFPTQLYTWVRTDLPHNIDSLPIDWQRTVIEFPK